MRTFPLVAALGLGLTLTSVAHAQEKLPNSAALVKALDKNGDGHVDEDELVATLKPRLIQRLQSAGLAPDASTSGRLDEHLWGVAEDLLALHDRAPADGKLDPKELDAALEAPLGSIWAFQLKDLFPDFPELHTESREESGTSLWTKLQTWIDVRQSFIDDQGIGEPAVFSYTSFGRNDETLEEGVERTQLLIQAAVSLSPDIDWIFGRISVRPVFAWEADITNGHKDDGDIVIHRAGVALFRGSATTARTPGLEHHVRATIDWTTDRKYRSDLFGGTIEWFPNWASAGIGQYVAHAPDQKVLFRWRPYVGLALGGVTDAAGREDLEAMDGFADAFVRIAAEVSLSKRLLITPTVTGSLRLRQDNERHAIVELPLQLVLARDDDDGAAISIIASYTHGEKAPLYRREQYGVVGLGIKF